MDPAKGILEDLHAGLVEDIRRISERFPFPVRITLLIRAPHRIDGQADALITAEEDIEIPVMAMRRLDHATDVVHVGGTPSARH